MHGITRALFQKQSWATSVTVCGCACQKTPHALDANIGSRCMAAVTVRNDDALGVPAATSAYYLEHVSRAMSNDVEIRATGLRALVGLLKHTDKRTVPDTLLYQLAFAHAHERFGMQLLSVLLRRWPPSPGNVSSWLRAQLVCSSSVIASYAASDDAAERRWFWKLVESVWPLDGGEGPITCCVIQPPADAIGLLTAFVVNDTARHRPHALAIRLHSATKLSKRLLRASVPAVADAADRLQKLCKLLLQHHGPLLCKNAHTAGIFAVLVHTVLRPLSVLSESWAALLWSLIHCEPTQLLAMLIVEELAYRGAEFMLPLLKVGLFPILLEQIERVSSPDIAIAAMFSLTQLAAHELVWVQLVQPDTLRRLCAILHTAAVCETIQIELRSLLRECARDPAPFLRARFTDSGLGALVPARRVSVRKATGNSRSVGAAPPAPRLDADMDDTTSEDDSEDDLDDMDIDDSNALPA
jgi:hypothetical protein